jgi:uncharacterized membrane protein YhaH (DUF805 family)
MSSILIAAALVPVMAALYVKRPLTREAGLWSCVGGVVAVVGREIEVWQEYAVLMALPVSLLAFVAGKLAGRPPKGGPPPPEGAATGLANSSAPAATPDLPPGGCAVDPSSRPAP